MKIVVANRQKMLPINARGIKALARHAVERLSARGEGRGWCEIAVVLTDDEGIRPINWRCFGRGEATDVISFRYDPMPGDKGLHSAEVVVNVQRAIEREGAGRIKRVARELALYILHGCDHLSGAADRGRRERDRMRRREVRLLKQAERLGYLDDLIGASK